MTVHELITELEKFSPEAEVEAFLSYETVHGFGSAPGEICAIEKVPIGNRVQINVADIFTLGHV